MKIRTSIFSLLTLAAVGCSSTGGKGKMGAQDSFAEGEPKPVSFWWPQRLDLSPLRQHSVESNPYSQRFNYAKEFKKLNLKKVKADIEKVLTNSQDWWPADWGNYGPFFIRMAWHSAGTYRVTDGRGGAAGGQLRLEPQNSWPDNANLDKARRLLWPIKKKYGKRLSWADLMILAGNVSLESMGFNTIGFSGGRTDDWEPDLVYWGSEQKFLDSNRHHKGKRKLKKPFGATRMGLIYVNPVGPNGVPDPLLAAQDIRENFGRMAMNDEETAALIAGGHTFGKAHGAHKPEDCVDVEPAAAAIEEQGLGWKNKCGKGHSEDTVTSGLEGAWTAAPTRWTHQYLQNLYNFKWVQTKSPAGAIQWVPEDGQGKNLVPDAHVKRKSHAPIMFTTDLALKKDPSYGKITKEWLENPKKFEDAFARAWFKLTHRDMGPKARYVGKETPRKSFLWQDPLPRRSFKKISSEDAKNFKSKILASGLSTSELVRAAWASASSYRATDMRGGANGARVSLAPQKNWEVNNPKELAKVLAKLKKVQKAFNSELSDGKKVSLADTIVLGGAAAIEKAARKAGVTISVPFRAGRVDASQKQTDVSSFENLRPLSDPFRNYYSSENYMSPTQSMIDRANMLALTVPQMTALVGGMRVLGANSTGSTHGIFTKKVGTLSNDFFVNLLDMSTEWKKSSKDKGVYEGFDRKTGKLKWTGTSVDLIFGSHSELRAIAEVYGANDGKRKFIKDFVKAWSKVMQADRFDLR
jgi:catalase-peroxidase